MCALARTSRTRIFRTMSCRNTAGVEAGRLAKSTRIASAVARIAALGLIALWLMHVRRKFDVVVVWKFDRFARSTSHLLRALEEFSALGIDFVSVTEAIGPKHASGQDGVHRPGSGCRVRTQHHPGTCYSWAERSA